MFGELAKKKQLQKNKKRSTLLMEKYSLLSRKQLDAMKKGDLKKVAEIDAKLRDIYDQMAALSTKSLEDAEKKADKLSEKMDRQLGDTEKELDKFFDRLDDMDFGEYSKNPRR